MIERIALHQGKPEGHDAWEDVYMIAHAVQETCLHPEWESKLEELEKELQNL